MADKPYQVPGTPAKGKAADAQAVDPDSYTPSEEDQAKVSEVDSACVQARTLRRPHEQQWFLNKAMERGNQYVVSVAGVGNAVTPLTTPPAPTHRVRLTINKIQPTLRSRASKFLKGRPVPQVVPATGDSDDRQNARFTSRALEYQTRRLRIEAKYGQCVRMAQLYGHGYLWVHWDPSVAARVKVKDPLTQQSTIELLPNAGDVALEEDGPWTIGVADATLPYIGDQPWIVRQKVRTLAYVQARFPGRGNYVAGEVTKDDAFRYEQMVGSLNVQGVGSSSGLLEGRETPVGQTREDAKNPAKTYVVVKEYFERPCPTYPQGRYLVVANGVLLKEQEELPHGFADMANPYPVVDFTDFPQVGQYWGTTVCEQLIPLQREYNLMRSKLAEHIRLVVHPKFLVAKQHRVAPGAWGSNAGEIVEYFAVPNLPEPKALFPPNIAADTWRTFELLNKEFADISHIYPESEGQTGSATSGFQTNLLQEAVDAIHKPDVDAHGWVLEELYYKIRRLMKNGYGIDRLLTISGHDLEPEAFEFSGEQIDDYADVVMIPVSALPKLPSARSQQILEYWKAGVYGPVDDPEARRKVAAQLEMGTVEDLYTDARKDEQQARIENDSLLEGAQLQPPQFYENHDLHYRTHTDLLKSSRKWEEGQREQLLAHVILHVKFQNPQSAVQLALQYGMPQLVQDLLPQAQAGMPPSPQGNGGPAPQGAPPPSPPPSGPTGPAAGPAGLSAPAPQAPPPPQGPGGGSPF